ncbi:MAG: pitrilysin family protein [Proteobacteria bacterium]|nr:pitrilysin family protein [Pseudomonadota bacterium]
MSRRNPLFAVAAVVLGLGPGCALLPSDDGFAWDQPPPPPAVAPVVPPGALTRSDLENGLRILVLEDRRLPLATVGVTLRRGAALVERSEAGLAQYTAELMKRGAGDRDALALARSVDRIGATLDVAVDWDSMTVVVSGLSRDLDRLMDVLADVVLRPRFDLGEGVKARDEKLAALGRAADDPGTLVGWHFARVLYPEHRYGLPLTGTPESVATLDAGSARAFHRRVFVPGNSIFSAVGDVDAQDLVRRARDAFGPAAWAAAEVPPPAAPAPAVLPPARRIVVVDRPDLVQSRIVVGHEGIERTYEERVPADLMNKVLGGSGFASRLMQRVRSDEGLTYGVWSGFSLRRQPGPFRVSTFTRAPETRRVVDLLLSVLAEMVQDPPDGEELANAKSLAAGRFGLGLETSQAVMGALVDLDVYGMPDDLLDTYRTRVAAVTVELTAAAARRLLHPDRAAIVVLGPAESLVPLLEGLGEIQLVSPTSDGG